ncbi:MAG: hypothetical protein COA97_12900 [Flavobacteriales bacterium]|nr:MAG: hypothetical protein COA97_12900 [Flavobacteriales bacterium]
MKKLIALFLIAAPFGVFAQNNLHDAKILGSISIGNKEITSVLDETTGCTHKSNLHAKNLFVVGESVKLDMESNPNQPKIIKPNLPEVVFVDKCKGAITDEEVALLKQDIRIITIRNNSEKLANELDATIMIAIINDNKELTQELYNNYGVNKIRQFINEIKKDGRNDDPPNTNKGDGNSCNKNSDGTVNMDSCGFWDSVVVGITSILCPTDPEFVYDCIQAAVCSTCSSTI